ncbi:MAG: hypothetical protein WD625_04770 [Balneolales bacterium]
MIKKILKYTAAFIASFLILIVAAYFAYPYINEDDIPEGEMGMDVVEQLREEVEAEEAAQDSIEVDPLTVMENKYQGKIDSLYVVMEEMEAHYKEELADKKEVELSKDMEDVTRALLNLDERVVAPIVNQLEDDQLIKLYRAGSNMQRERLLGSLDPDKASNILRQVIL